MRNAYLDEATDIPPNRWRNIAFGLGLTPFRWQWGFCTVLPGTMFAIGPFRISWRW